MTKPMEILAAKVKEKRKSYGYSTAELAKLLHVSNGLVNNIENSKNDVFKLQLLNNLLNLLNIPIFEVLEIKPSNQRFSINNDNLTINLDISNISESDKQELVKAVMPVLKSYIEITASYQGNKRIIKQVNNCVLQQLSLFKLINCS